MLPQRIQPYLADLLMVYLILILGLHFIIVKDALDNFEPLTFNAIRFLLGATVMGFIAWRNRARIKVARNDFIYLGVATVIGLAGYQALFVISLDLTTSTNTSLMVATMPTWTAILSVYVGRIIPLRGFSAGLLMTLAGVAVVILSSGGEISTTGNDVVGSLIGLGAAVLMAVFVVATYHIIQRYGGFTNSVLRHLFTTLGLTMFALPDLVSLQPSSIPVEILPNLFYSAFIAALSGYFIANYAIKKLGPTRFATYNNFLPLVTAVAAIIFLGEPLTLGLMVGGSLTLAGVALVRMTAKQVPITDEINVEPPLTQVPEVVAAPVLTVAQRPAAEGCD